MKTTKAVMGIITLCVATVLLASATPTPALSEEDDWMFEIHQAHHIRAQFESLAGGDPFSFRYWLGENDYLGEICSEYCGDSPEPCYRRTMHYQGMVRGNNPDGTPIFILSRNGNPGSWSWQDYYRRTDDCGDPCYGCEHSELEWYKECPEETVYDCPFPTVAPYNCLCSFKDDGCRDNTPGDLLVVDMGSREKDGESIGTNCAKPKDCQPGSTDRATRFVDLDGSLNGLIQWEHPGGGQLIGFSHDSEAEGVEKTYQAQPAFFGADRWCGFADGKCVEFAEGVGAIVILNPMPGEDLPLTHIRLYKDEKGRTRYIPPLQNMGVTIWKDKNRPEEEEQVVFAHSYSGKIQIYYATKEELHKTLRGNPATIRLQDEWDRSELRDEDGDLCDNPGNGSCSSSDFPEKPQNIALVQDTRGTLYLITLDRKIALFELERDAVDHSFGVKFLSAKELNTHEPAYLGDFLAAGTVYVSPEGRLIIYSAEHYPRGTKIEDCVCCNECVEGENECIGLCVFDRDPVACRASCHYLFEYCHRHCLVDCKYRRSLRMGEFASRTQLGAIVVYGQQDQVVGEGRPLFHLGYFSVKADPTGRTWQISVDWGDGSAVETHRVPTPGRIDRIVHIYADGPAEYTVTVTVTEGDAMGEGSFEVVVKNAAATVDAGPDQMINEGDRLTLAATFTDKGTLDTHTATVDWGDGAIVATQVTEPAGASPGRVEASHIYADIGTYQATVCVDDGSDEGCDTVTVVVTVGRPEFNLHLPVILRSR